jgi:hypothetical protein
MYYNKSRSTVYILLDTAVDCQKLAQFAESLSLDSQVPPWNRNMVNMVKSIRKFTRICQENVKTLVAQYESNIIRTLLLLFWISHLVVVSHITSIARFYRRFVSQTLSL